jgi:hypothetical protein
MLADRGSSVVCPVGGLRVVASSLTAPKTSAGDEVSDDRWHLG